MIDDVKMISLEDGTFYYYKIKPYSLTNALDTEVAQLSEYIFSINPVFDTVILNLYRTIEGNWYDMNDRSSLLNNPLIHTIKRAMDNSTVAHQ